MTKYRLKKDTPAFRSGYIFETDPKDEGVLLDKEGVSAFYENEIDDFDEWFEPVADEWPQIGDVFWSISSDAISCEHDWHNYAENRRKKAIGNVFKTRKAADRFIDYLKAITVVRQDEGVIDLQGVSEMYKAGDKYDDFCVYTIAYDLYLRKLVITDSDEYISANAIWFEDKEHADDSLNKHQDEWLTIANYDWSKE